MPPTVSCSAISKSTNCLSSGWLTLGFAIRLSNSDNEPNAVVSLMCFSRVSVVALGAGAGGDVDCATARLTDNVAIVARSKRRFICWLHSHGRDLRLKPNERHPTWLVPMTADPWATRGA